MFKRLGLLFGLIMFSLLTVSCASYFVRKDCEKKNWYQVGYDAALRGDRISNDETVSTCRKADAEISESQLDVGFKAGMSRYCQADGVFQTGKNGDLFNTDFCEPGQLSMLKQKHQDGLDTYCSDGMSAGLSGKAYKNVCKAQLEKSFLPEYRKGRKKYLQGMINNTEGKIRESDMQINNVSNQKMYMDRRISMLPSAKPGNPDPYADERSRLSSESWSLSSQISQLTNSRQKLTTELDRYQREIVTLD